MQEQRGVLPNIQAVYLPKSQGAGRKSNKNFFLGLEYK